MGGVKTKTHGCFITFEGSEGCGKSTQIRRLASRLRRLGLRVLCTHEPGGTPVGDRIRHLLKFSRSAGDMTSETELLLFVASRAQIVRERIMPALARGEIVLCDRFADSTEVYQGIARALDRALVRRLNRFATGGLTPDLTLFLDFDPSKGLARARRRAKAVDRMESQKAAFYRAVQRGFQALARRQPRRVRKVNASGTVEEVAAAIWHEAQRVLPKKALG